MEAEQVARTNGQLSAPSQPSQVVQLSNEMVRIYKEIFGRGPTRTRADWAGPDTLLCTLEDSLTPAERKMAELGEHQRLREMRTFFQHVCEDELSRVGRADHRPGDKGVRVRHRPDKDVSSEVFYFERPA